MSRFTERLWGELARTQGPALAQTDRPAHGRSQRILRRPRVLAGSTLGLAGVGAALVLVLGGSSAPAAFAVTRQSDGSIVVKIDYVKNETFAQADAKLKAMGTDEQIDGFQMARGAAPTPGPVACERAWGPARPTGPQVKVLVGADGTEVIGPGQSGDNTAEGSFHMQSCTITDDAGNTGGAPPPVASEN